jgi:hypothetical protein
VRIQTVITQPQARLNSRDLGESSYAIDKVSAHPTADLTTDPKRQIVSTEKSLIQELDSIAQEFDQGGCEIIRLIGDETLTPIVNDEAGTD